MTVSVWAVVGNGTLISRVTKEAADKVAETCRSLGEAVTVVECVGTFAPEDVT
jgi:hypothetical protein